MVVRFKISSTWSAFATSWPWEFVRAPDCRLIDLRIAASTCSFDRFVASKCCFPFQLEATSTASSLLFGKTNSGYIVAASTPSPRSQVLSPADTPPDSGITRNKLTLDLPSFHIPVAAASVTFSPVNHSASSTSGANWLTAPLIVRYCWFKSCRRRSVCRLKLALVAPRFKMSALSPKLQPAPWASYPGNTPPWA